MSDEETMVEEVRHDIGYAISGTMILENTPEAFKAIVEFDVDTYGLHLDIKEYIGKRYDVYLCGAKSGFATPAPWLKAQDIQQAIVDTFAKHLVRPCTFDVHDFAADMQARVVMTKNTKSFLCSTADDPEAQAFAMLDAVRGTIVSEIIDDEGMELFQKAVPHFLKVWKARDDDGTGVEGDYLINCALRQASREK